MERVLTGVLPVDIAQVEAFGIAFDGLLQRGPQREQVVDALVCALQTVVAHTLELLDGALHVLLAEQVLGAFVGDAVEALELLARDLVEDHIAEASATQGDGAFRRDVLVAETDEELQGGDLGEVLFVEGEVSHCNSSSGSSVAVLAVNASISASPKRSTIARRIAYSAGSRMS
jgi:hypothetical protein